MGGGATVGQNEQGKHADGGLARERVDDGASGEAPPLRALTSLGQATWGVGRPRSSRGGQACDAGSNEGAEERRERRGMASRVRILADRRWAGFGDALAG